MTYQAEKKLLKLFCSLPSNNSFYKLNETTKKLLRKYSNYCVTNSIGNIDIAKFVLLTSPVEGLPRSIEMLVIQATRVDGKQGEITLFKLKMRTRGGFDHNKLGFLSIFPNKSHGKRKDGLGIPELSPFNLGPVNHGQPGVPVAQVLENFHQQSKQFLGETDQEFFKHRDDAFRSNVGMRHKVGYKGRPLSWNWVTSDGKLHRLNWVSSRQFYCNFYERLVKEKYGFKLLEQLVNNGVNIQICGFDAYAMTMTKQGIEDAYLQNQVPFGHERVLAAMIVLKEKDWPWRKYKTFDF